MTPALPCDAAREAVSARLDGEPDGLASGVLEAHLQGCAACRGYESDVAALSRRLRLSPVGPSPDLVTGVQQARARAGERRPRWSPARRGLVVLGVTQLVLGVQVLLADPAVDAHLHRESGVVDLALAVGILAAAARPWRAAGMLPVVIALAVGDLAVALLDVSAGAVAWTGELVHLLPAAGAVLLWQVRHRDRPDRGAPARRDPGEPPLRLADSA